MKLSGGIEVENPREKHETCAAKRISSKTGLKFRGRLPMSYLAPHIKQERSVQTKPNWSNVIFQRVLL